MALAAALLVGAGVLAVRSGLEAYRFLPSLDVAGGVFADVPPVEGPPSRRLARRVVVVLIDGLRLDMSYGRPFLDGMRARGVDGVARTHYPTMSRPNHVSIVTGVEPRWSGVRTNRFRSRVPLDSIMARAKAAGLRATFLSDGADGVLEMFTPTFHEANYASYEGIMDRSAALALDRGDELLLLWYSSVDDAGHAKGAASQEYRAAARETDARLAMLLESRIDWTRDAVIVVADHGHIDRGGHGGVEEEVMNVPLILAGAGVREGGVVLDARLIDVAPTVAALLGVPAPGHALGRTLTNALAIDAGEAQALAAADEARQSKLAPIAEAARAEWKQQAARSRTQRGVVVVVTFLVLAAFASWAGGQGVVVLDRRVLLIAVPSFPTLFYGLIATFESWMSPSMVPAGSDITSKMFQYGLVSAAVYLVAAWIALRRRRSPSERLGAAAGLMLVGLVVAMAPAGAAWAVTGRPLAAMLPAADEIMLPPVTYTAVCCFAGASALLMAIEYVVFLARASDPLRFQRLARRTSP